MNSWYAAIRFWLSDSAAIVDRSLSSGVPAGITMGVFCDHKDSENSAMQIRIKRWRWMTLMLHLEEMCWAARQNSAKAQCDAKLPAIFVRRNPTAFAGWAL